MVKQTPNPSFSTHQEFDFFGPVGIFEGVVRVLIGQCRGTNGCNHDSLTVSTNRVFQKARELAIPVWNVRFFAL